MFSQSTLADRVISYFSSESGEIRYIFSPFIQKQTIEQILPDDGTNTIVITRWRRDDLVSGVSDPHVFEFCKTRGYTLKINSRLHAKVYSWDLEDALIGSANVTGAGMGEGQSPNIEVLTDSIDLPIETQLKLRRAENHSQLVTEADYQKAVEINKEATKQSEPNQEIFDIGSQPEFLTSQLPTTPNIDTIVSVLKSDRDRTIADIPAPLRRCVLHDISTYSLEDLEGCSESEVKNGIKQCFENHPFIREIIDSMQPHIYFGEMKELVQKKCTDVPTPSRRELTDDVQILYTWFHDVSPDRFEHDVPGSRSERLTDTQSPRFMKGGRKDDCK